MANFFRAAASKRRKYPIKYDEAGRTARSRAFAAFDRGLRPAQVIREVNISLRTACRYFADWKKLPPSLEERYRLLERMIRRDPGLLEQIAEVGEEELGVPREETRSLLQTPWGRNRILAGHWPLSKGGKPSAQRQSREAAANELVYLLELDALHRRIRALFDKLCQAAPGPAPESGPLPSA